MAETRMLDGQEGCAAAPRQGTLTALPNGHVLNEYRIERILGGGGFGLTYLARDTHLDCLVAIKEYLPKDVARRDEDGLVRPSSAEAAAAFDWGLQRFLLESRALASFHHPGIVRVLRYFRANETAYMVMEYETGEPLQRWLVGRLPLDRATLLRIVRPLLDGLEAVHAAGFLHRDIKPGNIYIRADGSPVLLDFGSARRLETDGPEQALTAIVTPGFAPAEQYHRHGKQGPWTDLYALAGVMYWMVTGKLPVEAFARLREDVMPSASSIGNVDAFGSGLLRAIDWALNPDENRRPRQVADFRRACLAPPTGGEGPVDPPVEAPLPLGLSAAEARTFIGAVLFADVAGPAEDMAARNEGRTRLVRMLSQAIAPLSPTTRLAVNTKEGCAVCYVGDPEDALRTAVQLHGAAVEDGLGVHVGINLGPVRVAPDPNGRSRILGDGITTACRVMRFAEPGQVLVARAYYEVVQHLRRNASDCFRHLGLRRDPQARDHDVYAWSGEGVALLPGQPAEVSISRPVAGADISPACIDAAERTLAQHIGPMARILVRKTVSRAASLVDLHQQLATLIPDPAPRAAFLAGVAAASGLSGASRATAATHSRPLSSGSKASVSGAASGSASPAVAVGLLADEDLARIEKLFARHMGPMARVLVRREVRGAHNLETLCRALASHLEQDAERRRFLAEAGFGGAG
ncbi:protein kinase domain-containing protein [Zoogloea dura]|uniref:Protein kinase n=1 Tax=Zoogloea dura TaxID=2728840 RepID=A0A848GAC7_9RHOO|nr:protein kinase [Zoogloea dura]NML28469.1 protein kinase [Zoogloea dura]